MGLGPGSWVVVCLLGVPVDVYLASQQHTDDLLRELWLMSVTDHGTDGRGADYRRLVEAADAYTRRGAEVRNVALELVLAAHERGEPTVNMEFRVPAASADLTERWGALLDEMNALCVRGELLTLAAAEDVLRFREWYVGEVLGQIRQGRPPQSFDQWARTQVSTGS